MTRSVEELITEDIVQTLQGISPTGGYLQDFQVQRLRRLGNDINSNTLVLIDGDLALHPEQSLGRDRWIKNYTVVCPIMIPAEEGSEQGTVSANIRADVYKALNVDPYRAGLAIDTRFSTSRADSSSDAPYESLEFEVHFFTNMNDPYSYEDIT